MNPPDGLIWNMACRYDHSFAFQGYDLLHHEQRKAKLVKDMAVVFRVVQSYYSSLEHLPSTPCPSLLSCMSRIIPNSSLTSMSQLYEEIRNYPWSLDNDAAMLRPVAPPQHLAPSPVKPLNLMAQNGSPLTILKDWVNEAAPLLEAYQDELEGVIETMESTSIPLRRRDLAIIEMYKSDLKKVRDHLGLLKSFYNLKPSNDQDQPN